MNFFYEVRAVAPTFESFLSSRGLESQLKLSTVAKWVAKIAQSQPEFAQIFEVKSLTRQGRVNSNISSYLDRAKAIS